MQPIDPGTRISPADYVALADRLVADARANPQGLERLKKENRVLYALVKGRMRDVDGEAGGGGRRG